jgi:hypothetical protein
MRVFEEWTLYRSELQGLSLETDSSVEIWPRSRTTASGGHEGRKKRLGETLERRNDTELGTPKEIVACAILDAIE